MNLPFGFLVFTRYIVVLEKLAKVASLVVQRFRSNKEPMRCGDGRRRAKVLYPANHFCSSKSMPSSRICVLAIAWKLRSRFCSLFCIVFGGLVGRNTSQMWATALRQAFSWLVPRHNSLRARTHAQSCKKYTTPNEHARRVRFPWYALDCCGVGECISRPIFG